MANGTNQTKLTQRVVRHIHKKVQSGILKTGDKLPTNRALSEELGVSIQTIQRSLKQLESQGIVNCLRSSGTFLIDPNSLSNPKIQSGLIGLFIPEVFANFHTDLLLELETNMALQGKLLSINFTHSQPEREIMLLRSLARQRLEALIYCTSPLAISSESYSRTISSWLNRYIQEGSQIIFADLCPPDFESRLISIDNSRAGTMLTNKLIERGHKNIAFLGPTHIPTARDRLKGHYNALEKAGLPINNDWHLDVHIMESTDWHERIEKNIRELISLHPDLTGFVVSTQATAETLHRVLKGFPDRDFSAEESIASLFETATPPFEALAWIQIPGKKMGRKACEILLGDHPPNYEPGHIKIKPVFWK